MSFLHYGYSVSRSHDPFYQENHHRECDCDECRSFECSHCKTRKLDQKELTRAPWCNPDDILCEDCFAQAAIPADCYHDCLEVLREAA